ncbi:hypothetical protein [Rhodococcus sp. Chr-9]|uniref:hypothetical protein n=1 Tax=Rhodococcus sp. Chr-9 TaxID=713612 RepID=UPI000573849A|nr:hypothetical protein [Rhodococcus sp. Chr-9]KHJ74661.1 hypothetical protein QR64_00290 [Rhodococcus sp. Chr-9]
MERYRKKPVEIEALQLRWDTWPQMCEFAPVGTNGCRGVWVDSAGSWSDEKIGDRLGLLIPTLEGDMLAVEDDYIIRGVKGEFYPCKPDIFAATYEPVEE